VAVGSAVPATVSSIGSVPSSVPAAIRNLEVRVIGGLPTLTGVLPVPDGILLRATGTSGSSALTAAAGKRSTVAVEDAPASGGRGPAADQNTISRLPEQVPSPAAPAPIVPYPLPQFPLSSGDGTLAAFTGQGASPFGSLPPSSLLLPALAFAAVLLTRRKTPRLLLDTRCSPPG
jgi:hypothetical protein